MARKKKSVADQNDSVITPNSTKTSSPAPAVSNTNTTKSKPAPVVSKVEVIEASQSQNDQVLTATQKKNLKKKLRRQELKQQESHIHENNPTSSSALQSLIQQKCKVWDSDIKKIVAKLERQDPESRVDKRAVLEQYQNILKEMQNFHSTELVRAKKPISKTTNTEGLENQIKTIETTLIKQQKDLQKVQHTLKNGKTNQMNDANAALEWEAQSKVEESLRYLTHLREQLMLMNQMKELHQLGDKIKQYKDQCDAISRQMGKNEGSGKKSAQEGSVSNKEQQWRRRLSDLNVKVPGTNCHFTVMPCNLSGSATRFLFDGDSRSSQSLALRKIERRFGVLIEKASSSPQHLAVNVIGINPDPINRCITFLSECNFPSDENEPANLPNVVSLEKVNIGALVGSGGANIRTLESETGLIICIDKNRLIAFGTDSDIAANMAKIQSAISGCNSTGGKPSQHQAEGTFPTNIVRALSQGGTSMRSKILAIENSNSVSINLRVNKKDDENPTTVVTIRGKDTASCNTALNALTALTKGLGIKKIECDDTKAYRLLRGAPPNFFPILLDKELVCPLKTNGGVILVGPSNVLDNVYADGMAALENLTRVSEVVEINAADLKYFGRTKRSEIELESGAICRPPTSKGEVVTLTFFGSANQVKKAKELVEKYIQDMGVEEKFNSSLDVVMVLTADKALKLRQLENILHLRIIVDRATYVLTARGKPDALKKFATELARVENEVKNDTVNVSHVLDMPEASIPMVIGRGGANIRRLQNECGLAWVHVDNKNNSVILRGPQDCITQALTMIDSFVSSDNKGAGLSEGKETRIKNTRQPRGARPNNNNPKGSKKNDKKPSEPWNMDEAAFPSLGGDDSKIPEIVTIEEYGVRSPAVKNTVMTFDEDLAN